MSQVWIRVGLTLQYPLQPLAVECGGVVVRTNADGWATAWRDFDASLGTSVTSADQERQALLLLDGLNRVLRLYRFYTHDADVVELTLSSAGTFTFIELETQRPWGPSEGLFQVLPTRSSFAMVPDLKGLDERIQRDVKAGAEPPVWHLLVLDAEVASAEGRFREAVLLAWSAIESCFGTHYGRWISRLTELSSDERAGLVGRDISLANQMTAGLAIAIGVPLHQLLGKDWAKRRTTYRTRNSIIHEGGSASAAQAIEALAFARRVVEVVETVAAQHEQEVTEHG